MSLRSSLPVGVMLLALAACGSDSVQAPGGTDQTSTGCNGSCSSAGQVLTQSDVQQVLARGINEARARGHPPSWRKTTVRIVAIGAVHEPFIDAVLERHRKLRSHTGVTAIAKVGLF